MKTLTLLTPLMLSGIKPKPKEFSLYDAQCEGLALRIQPSGVRSWVFWERVDGKTRKITLGKYPDMTLEEARQSMHAHQSGLVLSAPLSNTTITFATLCERFLSAKEGIYRPSTIGPLNDYLRTQLLPAFGNQQVGRIRTPEIARWFHAYSRLRAGGANQALGHFTTILNWGKAQGHLPYDLPNPAAPLRKNRRAARGRMLNAEQLRALAVELNKVKVRHRVSAQAIRLILLTGCRSGEILRLRWSEVTKSRLRLSQTKTGPRDVLLSDPASQILKALRTGRKSLYVFPSIRNLDHPRSSIDGLWRCVRSRAGLPDDIRLHDLRHTYASHAILSGESLPITGRLLGHTSPRSTRRYTHLDGGTLANAADKVAREIEKMMESG